MDTVKQTAIISVLLMGLIVLSGDTAAVQDAQNGLRYQIDSYFTQLADSQSFSGAVLFVKDNNVVLRKGYGLANDAEGTAVTSETVFDIGSISKQFTASGILHLEMQGLLDVNDSITNFFNNVPIDKAGITIHHLLTHSAGFTRDHFHGDLIPMTKEEALQAIFAQELGFEPGAKYHYSNTGYTLLAMIIEEISGQSYTSFLRDGFFEPLGMSSTGFYGDTHWESLPVANAYFNGKDQGQPSEWPGPYWGVMGNGGIMSTVDDLYTWWQALENHTIVNEIQTKKLLTLYISEGGGSYYGYGWSLMDTALGPLITHNGGGIGGNSDFAVYTDQNLIIIIAGNRIVWRTLFNTIPYEIRLPATEARQQIAENIASGDFSKLPSATLQLASILGIVIGALVVVSVIAILLFKSLRTRVGKSGLVNQGAGKAATEADLADEGG